MKTLSDMTEVQLKDMLKEGKYMLFFTADWCGDCRFIKPVMPEIEADYSEYTFIEVDRDQFLDLCVEWNIFGIPSFVAIEDGKELARFVNKDRKTKIEVEKFIDSIGK